jgi:hypothetical protein
MGPSGARACSSGPLGRGMPSLSWPGPTHARQQAGCNPPSKQQHQAREVDVELRLPGGFAGKGGAPAAAGAKQAAAALPPRGAAAASAGGAAAPGVLIRRRSSSTSTAADATVQWFEPRGSLMSHDSFRSATSSLASAYYDCVEQTFSVDAFLESYCTTTPSSPLATGAAARLLTLNEGEAAAWRAAAAAGLDGHAAGAEGAHAAPHAIPRAPQSVVEPPVEYVLRRYKQVRAQ